MKPSDTPVTSTDSLTPVIHNTLLQRFEIQLGAGEFAVLSYIRENGQVVFEHVHVPEKFRGQGIAAILTRAALDEARLQRWVIVPRCTYVAAFIERNPAAGADGFELGK